MSELPVDVGEALRASKLWSLYEDGLLAPVLEQFGHLMTATDVLGCGNDALCFRGGSTPLLHPPLTGRTEEPWQKEQEREEEEVVKLCTKQIGYFTFRPGATAEDFARDSRELGDCALPVRRVLYEDAHVFVYTQARWARPFGQTGVTREMARGFWALAHSLLTRARLWMMPSPHNLALRADGRVVLFDYHDLRPFVWDEARAGRVHWWRRLVSLLVSQAAHVYAPEQRRTYKQWARRLTDSRYRRIATDRLLPLPILGFLRLLRTARLRGHLSLWTVCDRIHTCIEAI